jgi:hypothetical protein
MVPGTTEKFTGGETQGVLSNQKLWDVSPLPVWTQLLTCSPFSVSLVIDSYDIDKRHTGRKDRTIIIYYDLIIRCYTTDC